MDEPLFSNTHNALVFAFNYAAQHSPNTPWMTLIKSPGDAPLGSGKGLIGVDGAGQAGMILAAVCRLPDDQHNIIVAKYGYVLHECERCQQDAPSDEWRNAITALTDISELPWSHRRMRREAVEIALKKSNLKKDTFAKKYSISRSSMYRCISELEKRLHNLERLAMLNLDNAFTESALVA